jgi:hypothetical protein
MAPVTEAKMLDYSTRVDAVTTAMECVQLLAVHKVQAVAITYADDGHPAGVTFRLRTPLGIRQYTLPVNVSGTHAAIKATRVENRYKTREQAERTAWRVSKEWLKAQLALVQSGGAVLPQVMLPYMHVASGGVTAWEAYSSGQLAIGGGQA